MSTAQRMVSVDQQQLGVEDEQERQQRRVRMS
jgi:hypothetical protein